MHSEHEQGTLTDLTGNLVGQSLNHFDPFQGLIDNEEKAEELRNMRYGFRAGTQNILINRATVCEVVQSVSIYRIPNTRPWVMGVINLRGNLVPVFDLMKRLDDTATKAEDQQLLVFDQGDRAAGIFIDGLPKALKIDDEDAAQRAAIPADTPDAIRAHATAAYRVNESIWLEINHSELLSELMADASVNSDTLA